MKPLRNAVEDYIALRRSLGFKLRDMATGLTDFVSFLEQKAASYLNPAYYAPDNAIQRAVSGGFDIAL